MAELDTDSFDRANSTTLGNSAGGFTWVEYDGNLEIFSNVVQNVSNNVWGHARLPVTTLTSLDHYAQADVFIPNISGASCNGAVEVRKGANSTLTFYSGEWYFNHFAGVTRLRITKWVAGAQSTLQTMDIGARAQTHTIRLEVRNSTSPVSLSLYYDGVLRLSHSDASSPITTGTQTGIGAVGQAAGKVTINNFSCGDFASTPPPPPPPPPPAISRDPYMWPFSPDSAFNKPIGANATYAPVQSPVFIPGSGININVTQYSQSIFHAAPTDPLVPLYRSNYPSPGVHTLQWTVRVPTIATPNGGTDGHMMIVDEDEVFVYESGVVRAYTGAQGAGWRGEHWWQNNIRQTGIYAVFHGSRAWGNCGMGGIIRAGEPENGFRHALVGTIENQAYHGPGHVWPANSQDNNLGTTGNVYEGGLLAIPASVDINALGITDARALNFARCMQDYGIYLGESGNTFSGMVINANGAEAAQLQFPARTQGNDYSHPFWYGMSLATAQLQVVTNNVSTTPATEGAGGGAPRVPMAPAFGDNAVGVSVRLDRTILPAAVGTVGLSFSLDREILAPPGITVSLYRDIQGTPSPAGTGERTVAILDGVNEVKILSESAPTREVKFLSESAPVREVRFLAPAREVIRLRGQTGFLRAGGAPMGKESFTVRAGTTENLDFQLFLNKAPVSLGAPSAMQIVRKTYDDVAITPNIDLVLVTAALGKVRWEMLTGETVLAHGGYRCYIVISGGDNPGTFPSHGYFNIGLE